MSNSLLSIGNADYVDSLYRQYLADPSAVGAEWHRYFASLADEETVSAIKLTMTAAVIAVPRSVEHTSELQSH